MFDCDGQLIDSEHLDELGAVLCDQSVGRLVGNFIGGLQAAVQDIIVLASSGAFMAVRSAAHALHGAALGLGCPRVARLCHQIEMADGDNNDLANELLIAAQMTVIALTRWITLKNEVNSSKMPLQVS